MKKPSGITKLNGGVSRVACCLIYQIARAIFAIDARRMEDNARGVNASRHSYPFWQGKISNGNSKSYETSAILRECPDMSHIFVVQIYSEGEVKSLEIGFSFYKMI